MRKETEQMANALVAKTRKVLVVDLIPGNVVLLFLVILIGIVLRGYALDAQSLWYDEAWSVKKAGESFGAVLKTFEGSMPAFHLLILHFVMKLFGNSEVSGRFPSVMFGSFSLFLLYLVGAQIFDKKVALVASFIAAISPFHIWYSQEARAYSLLIMLSLASMWFFLKLLEGSTLWTHIGYILTTTLILYTHVEGASIMALQNLFLLYRWKKLRNLREWLVCQTIIFVLFSPGLLSALSFFGSGRGAGFEKAVDLMAIPYTFFAYSVGFSVGPSVAQLHVSRSLEDILPYSGILMVLFIVFASISLLGFHSLFRDKEKAILISLYLLIPISSVYAISQIQPSLTYNVRYTSIAIAAYYLVLAKGVTSIRNRGLMLFLLLAIVLCSTYSLWNYYGDDRYAKEDARSAAEYIERNSQSGDAILVVGIDYPFAYYYGGTLPVHSIPVVRSDEAPTYLERIPGTHSRLWLVLGRTWQADPEDLVKKHFDRGYSLIDQQVFPGVRLYCYQLSAKGERGLSF